LRYRNLQVNHHPTDLPLPCSRTNLAATLANAQINPSSKYGKVFPHMCDDGRYPSDFNTPKTVETMKVLDSKYPFFCYLVLTPIVPHFEPRTIPFHSSIAANPVYHIRHRTATKLLRFSTRPNHAILPAPPRPSRRPTSIFIWSHQPLRQR
jgi:hypothetical protein